MARCYHPASPSGGESTSSTPLSSAGTTEEGARSPARDIASPAREGQEIIGPNTPTIDLLSSTEGPSRHSGTGEDGEEESSSGPHYSYMEEEDAEEPDSSSSGQQAPSRATSASFATRDCSAYHMFNQEGGDGYRGANRYTTRNRSPPTQRVAGQDQDGGTRRRHGTVLDPSARCRFLGREAWAINRLWLEEIQDRIAGGLRPFTTPAAVIRAYPHEDLFRIDMARLSILAGRLHMGQSPFPLPTWQQSVAAAGLHNMTNWDDLLTEAVVISWRDRGYNAQPTPHQSRRMLNVLGDTLNHIRRHPGHPSRWDSPSDIPEGGLGRAFLHPPPPVPVGLGRGTPIDRSRPFVPPIMGHGRASSPRPHGQYLPVRGGPRPLSESELESDDLISQVPENPRQERSLQRPVRYGPGFGGRNRTPPPPYGSWFPVASSTSPRPGPSRQDLPDGARGDARRAPQADDSASSD